MTSNEQTSAATAPEQSQADQLKNTSNVAPPTAPATAAKTPAKKVARPSAKKTVAPAKAVAQAVPAKVAVKSVAKPAAKVVTQQTAPTLAAKTLTKAPAKTQAKAATASGSKPKVEKLLKAKKPKLVRDSFTIPKLEYLILEELKHRSGKLGNSSKKSELIRAGIKALASLSDANFVAALKAVPAIKTGRPAKD